MRLKLDENLSRHLKAELAELGHDVQTAAEEGLLGKSDREVGANLSWPIGARLGARLANP